MSYPQREPPILAQLCTLLVEDIYGELAARVFSVLARHGRQTLASVARASYLTSRQIKYGLVILIQQHLVFRSPADAPVTYYEIDWLQSYGLVRYGKITKMIQDRFEKKEAHVTINLLSLGHTRIGDLKDAYFKPDSDSDYESDEDIQNGNHNKPVKVNGGVNGMLHKTNGAVNGVSESSHDTPNEKGIANGIYKQHTTNHFDTEQGPEERKDTFRTSDDLYNTIQSLMHRGWVIKVHDSQYWSPGDLDDLTQQEAIETVNNGIIPTGPKMTETVRKETLRRKRAVRDDWGIAPKFSKKRRASDEGNGRPTKRLRINGETSHLERQHSSDMTAAPEDDVVIRVNPAKVAVAMRTEQLVRLVRQRMGSTTAHVYRLMLEVIESHIPRCYEPWPDPSPTNAAVGMDEPIDPRLLVTAREIARRVGRDFDVCEGLDPNAIVQVTHRGHVRSNGALSQPIDFRKLNLDDKTKIVDRHIQLLSDDPFHFVTWHSRSGYSQWYVEFEEIAKAVIQHEIENTVSARKGTLGVKLIRALKKKGKLDERQACNTMMMSAADIRGVITDLTLQGFIQTQEIPKVERREAKHSIHLIFYDRQRAREKLLHDTYKGMVRIMQRLQYEREKVRPLLSKAERSDVVGKEEQLLSQAELTALKKWKDVQEKLLLQLFREDELVATLRDFTGPFISV